MALNSLFCADVPLSNYSHSRPHAWNNLPSKLRPVHYADTFRRQLKACFLFIYRVAQKSKPLPNDKKTVLNRVKACQ